MEGREGRPEVSGRRTGFAGRKREKTANRAKLKNTLAELQFDCIIKTL